MIRSMAAPGRDRLTANFLFQGAEKVLGQPKAAWSGVVVRDLFDLWLAAADRRLASPVHEEAWWQVTGYLLRPGIGMPGDAERIDALWPLLEAPPKFGRKAVRLQRWIAVRRMAPGLNGERSRLIWEQAGPEWEAAAPSAEVAQLAGALEALPMSLRIELAGRMAEVLVAVPDQSAYWRSLGRLLSRALFHAGSGQVVPPETVVACWEKLRYLEVSETIRPEAAHAWLRAARLTGLRPLEVPGACRRQIDDRLRRWGITDVRRHPLHEVVPLVVAEQSALLGESLPPGLSLEG